MSSSSTIYRTRKSPPSLFNLAFASEKSITTSSLSRKVAPFGKLKVKNGFFGSTCFPGSFGWAGVCCDCLDSARKICRGGGETNVVAVVCALSLFDAHAKEKSINSSIGPNRSLRVFMRLSAYTFISVNEKPSRQFRRQV